MTDAAYLATIDAAIARGFRLNLATGRWFHPERPERTYGQARYALAFNPASECAA